MGTVFFNILLGHSLVGIVRGRGDLKVLGNLGSVVFLFQKRTDFFEVVFCGSKGP